MKNGRFVSLFLIIFLPLSATFAGTKDLGKAIAEQYKEQDSKVTINHETFNTVVPLMLAKTESLLSILKDGFAKNLHQTKTSNATANTTVRMLAERMYSQLPAAHGELQSLFPKYGLIAWLNDPELKFPEMYGEIIFQISPKVYDQMTYTTTDSFDTLRANGMNHGISDQRRKLIMNHFSSAEFFNDPPVSLAPNIITSYHEVQVWGDLNVNDFSRIYMPVDVWNKLGSEIQKAAEHSGFEVWTYQPESSRENYLPLYKMNHVERVYKSSHLNQSAPEPLTDRYRLSEKGEELIESLQMLRQTVMMDRVDKNVRIESLKILLVYGVFDEMLARSIATSLLPLQGSTLGAQKKYLVKKLNLENYLISPNTKVPVIRYIEWFLKQNQDRDILGDGYGYALAIPKEKLNTLLTQEMSDDLKDRIEKTLQQVVMSFDYQVTTQILEKNFDTEFHAGLCKKLFN